MRRATAIWAWLVIALSLAACTAVAPLPAADDGQRIHTVRATSNGWHTAMVVERAELAATGLVPEAADFPDATFIEFSWGDRVYFPAGEKTLGMTLDAALVATPSIMHVVGLERPPEAVYRDIEVVSLALSDTAFQRLVTAIAAGFERRAGKRAAPVSRGLYADSHFYKATGSFHLLNTCNTWTARMLRAGGIDISPTGIVTADEMVARLRTAVD